MLRIRKNVDLKELEKFGFRKYKYGYETQDTFIPEESYIRFKGKIIYEKTEEPTESYADTIYDLIQAGLVEKVDDEK